MRIVVACPIECSLWPALSVAAQAHTRGCKLRHLSCQIMRTIWQVRSRRRRLSSRARPSAWPSIDCSHRRRASAITGLPARASERLSCRLRLETILKESRRCIVSSWRNVNTNRCAIWVARSLAHGSHCARISLALCDVRRARLRVEIIIPSPSSNSNGGTH